MQIHGIILGIIIALVILSVQHLSISFISQIIPEAHAISNSTWASGQRIPVILPDPNANRNSTVADDLSVYDPKYDIPTMKIGNPFTLFGGNASFFKSSAIITTSGISTVAVLNQSQPAKDIAQDEIISGRPIYAAKSSSPITISNTGGIIIDLKTTMQTLRNTIHNSTNGNPEEFKGFNFLNLDLRSFKVFGVNSGSGINTIKIYLIHRISGPILDTNGNAIPNFQLISIANTTTLQDLINLSVASSKVPSPSLVNKNIFSVPDTDSIGLVFQFTTVGNVTFFPNQGLPMISDFFSIGVIGDGKSYYQRINNAAYRFELNETGTNTGTFLGTNEYIMLNQLNVFDTNTYSALRSIGKDVRFAAIQEMDQIHFNTPQIKYLPQVSSGHNASSIVSVQPEIKTHTGLVKFDKKQYSAGDTVMITVFDQDLNVDNDLTDIYTTVAPSGNLATDPQDIAVDTIGKVGLGANLDGSSFGKLLEVVFGKDDTRWSNSIIPHDANHTAACNFTGGVVNSGTGTAGGYATSFSGTGFSLVETGPSTGIFTGGFQFPDELCQSGNVASSTSQDIKVKYYDFSDDTGNFVEKDRSVGGYGFVDTLKIVPQFSKFTTINHVTPLPGNMQVEPTEVVPAVIFYRNSSVVKNGIDELTNLGLTPIRTTDILPSVAVDMTGSQINQIKNNFAVAIFRDIPVFPAAITTDKKIKADSVWPTFKGDGIKIAVLDTGVGTNQELDTPDCYNVFTPGSGCTDQTGHGTHVSGIAMARGIDNPNLEGVAPSASLLAVKVIENQGLVQIGTFATLAEGIDKAILNGSDVINISLASNDPFDVENCDLDTSTSDQVGAIYPYVYAAISDGVPVVASSGNLGHVGAPACISNVIAVGAVDLSGNPFTDSANNLSTGAGPAMKAHGLVAPGVGVVSTWPCDITATGCATAAPPATNSDSGTSMAAPAVTGTIALMLNKDRHSGGTLTPTEIANILFDTACTASCSISPSETMGHGEVDADAAVGAVGSPVQLRETSTVITTNRTTIDAPKPILVSATVSDVGSLPQSQPTGQVTFINWPNPDPARFTNPSCSTTTDNKLQCFVTYIQTTSENTTIMALYYGDEFHDMSHDKKDLKVHTITQISVSPSSPPPIPTTSNVVITAIVKTSTGIVSTGTITFDDGGKGGSFNNNGKCQVSASPCTLTYFTSSTNGDVKITASYSDDISDKYSNSEDNVTLSVGPEFPALITVIITIVFFAVVLLTRFGKPFIKIHG